MDYEDFIDDLKFLRHILSDLPQDSMGTVSEEVHAPDGEHDMLEWPVRDEVINMLSKRIKHFEDLIEEENDNDCKAT